MRLKIIIPSGDYELTSIEIRNRYRGSSTIYELDYSYRKHKDHLSIKARFDPNNRVYDGLFWDIFVIITESDGNTFEVPCYTGDAFRHSLYFRNLQCVLDDGNILFPYATKGTKLAFLHRKLHKSDTLMTRAKEWAAFFSYYLLLPYWHRRRIWLTYEKLCSHAQDNSYAFFKYCMDQIPERASKHVYYIIDKDVPEFKKVQQYGNNIVDFMSYRHMLYALAASIYVSSDSISHMYQWRPKPSVIRRLMDKRKMMFLQHGVTALKRVDHLFGTRGTTPMTYFVTTSSAEQAIVKSFGYSDKRAPILGFTRWDILEDKSNPAHPVVLMMPTWRRWLEDVDDQTFLDSDYFKSYSALINNSALLELLERRGVVLKYFIHPKLHEQLRHFDKTSERIQLIDIDTTPLNELIMECSALVTDYSSVSWDVLYMDKPVVYYQFDQERYLEESGSYVDLNVDLPGPVCMDAESVVNAVADIIDSGFELSSEYKNLAKKWYAFKDRNNCERTYNFLLSRGF
jgi:CDP-glycerol glycerophosphotransferase (TagB/SpsB family)